MSTLDREPAFDVSAVTTAVTEGERTERSEQPR